MPVSVRSARQQRVDGDAGTREILRPDHRFGIERRLRGPVRREAGAPAWSRGSSRCSRSGPQPAARHHRRRPRGAIRNGPLTLVSITIRHTSASVSQKRVGSVRNRSLTYFIPRPALLTRMSSRPASAQRRLDHPAAIRDLRHIRLDRDDAASPKFHLGGEGLKLSRFPRCCRDDGDPGPRARPRAIARPSPATAARDDGRLVPRSSGFDALEDDRDAQTFLRAGTSTSSWAFAFSRRDCTMAEPSLPRLGQATPSRQADAVIRDRDPAPIARPPGYAA